jgi:hypothetical protein
MTVVPGHELRRATSAKVVAIKDVLTNYKSVTSWSAWQGGKTVRNKDKSTSRVPLHVGEDGAESDLAK